MTAARDRDWLRQFILRPDKVYEAGDPIAVALRAKYKDVRMPNLALTKYDADLLIAYMDREGRAAAQSAPPDAAAPPPPQTAAPVNLAPMIDPYLRIQEALNADSLAGVKEAAGKIAAEAVQLGDRGASLRASAAAFERAGDLAAARTAIGAITDAILLLARSSDAGFGDGVKVAYCPMVRKYWLQKGDTIRNPYYGKAMSDCGRFSAPPQ